MLDTLEELAAAHDRMAARANFKGNAKYPANPQIAAKRKYHEDAAAAIREAISRSKMLDDWGDRKPVRVFARAPHGNRVRVANRKLAEVLAADLGGFVEFEFDRPCPLCGSNHSLTTSAGDGLTVSAPRVLGAGSDTREATNAPAD